ncbi:type VI secretion system baseplate subunit TssG [Enterobacter hormaechei]|uniref:Type VI secretion system baseplate subunit TssG n=1 Tax=Enterobacter hormaechei TaxID=158836 RepID=A0A6G4MKM3_9ENTR|nr:type VI secretion system baseplate subunit TssG [Enterobacter hormaechei]
MGREAQPPHSRLSPRLEADLHRINFYRLCQLLEKRNPGRPLMGSTSHPGDDPVRFAPHPGMGFPASELKAVEYDEDDDSRPPLIRTTFMGMYGVDSPLPMAYLDDIAQRREGHDALQGFLDIFSHRILTQFYRIWRKYSYSLSSGICRYAITTIILQNGDRSVTIMPEQVIRGPEKGCVTMSINVPDSLSGARIFHLSMAPDTGWYIRRGHQSAKENILMNEDCFFQTIDYVA